jgi:hypothetical protein
VGVALALVTSANSGTSGTGSRSQVTPIASLPFHDEADDVPNVDPTEQATAPSCAALSHASWYAFTPESDTPMTAWVVPPQNGPEALDVALVVWEVSADDELIEAGCVDDRAAGGTEQLVLAVSGEGTYYLQVGAVEGPDDGVVALTLLADLQQPEHDLFAYARNVGLTPYEDVGVDAIGARREPGESVPSCVDLDATTWYGITFPEDAILSATVTSAQPADDHLDAAMALHTGEAIDSLMEIACVNGAGVGASEHLEVPITGGEDYWLQVGAITDMGASPGIYTLSVDGLQAIDLQPLPDIVFGAAPVEVDVGATSGLPVAMKVSGPCRIRDGAVVAEGTGLCAITASQEGDTTWAPAASVTTTIHVARGRQAIHIEPVVDAVVGAPHPVTATAE